MSRSAARVLPFVFLLTLCVEAQAQWGEESKLDPREVASPSGTVTLFIDPSAPDGSGGAQYRCRRGTSELWSGARPWTLWEAVVGDDGVIAGYAYDNGLEGGGEDDALTVVILAPDGSTRLAERTPREGFTSDLGSPEPMVRGCFLERDRGRFIVRVQARSFESSEAWWTYTLADGAPELRFEPAAALGKVEHLGWLLDARPVPGSGLVLASWSLFDWESNRFGLVLALLDREGRLAWRLDWPDSIARDELPWRESPLLAVDEGRFTVSSRKTKERVSFALARTTGAREALEVREIARAPLTEEPELAAKAPEATEPAKTLALRALGAIDLSPVAVSSPIHDVMCFALDGKGRIGFVRRSDRRFDFVRCDADGQNLREHPLPEPPSGAWWSYELAWSAGESWFVSASDSGEGEERVWRFDVATSSFTELAHFASPAIESLAAMKDGGFVVLGDTSFDSGYFTHDLVAFDARGARRFALGGDQGDPQDESSLFSPEALTVLASGELVVLDNTRRLLQFFAQDGEFQYALELEQAWGREPNYPTGVHGEPGGDLVVHDFDGTPPIVRMDRDGKVLTEFQPRHGDGRTFRIHSGVQVGPDGALWTSDGQALLRLDAQGVVRAVLGPSASADELGKIGRIALGPGDRLHAVDPRTGAVHVFAPDGKRLHVCRPAPEDFAEELTLPSLSVSDSGEVLLEGLRFAADGTRLGLPAWPDAGYHPEIHARRAAEGAWMIGYEELLLVAREGSLLQKIERTPGGTWLRDLGPGAVAPDGSFALTTGEGASGALHLYTSGGAPVRTLPLPAHVPSWAPFAYDGPRFAFALYEEGKPGAVQLLDDHGRDLGRFTPAGERDLWIPYFAAAGKELWLFDQEYRIERYALP